jgi:hypothetical protein
MSPLVDSPVFILASVRSGSTLLRCILDSHSRIRAPHELHLGDLHVELVGPYVPLAMRAAGLDREELEHLLWDRLLHRELVTSGKEIIVDKTPANVVGWSRVSRCWPRARYLFLLRHPAAILTSALAFRQPERDEADVTDMVLMFLEAVTDARASLSGLTVRYEDLTDRPQETMEQVCSYLGVAFEPEMLDYGRFDHGPLERGIGDAGEKIRAGRVLPPTSRGSVGAALPSQIAGVAEEWGYPTAMVGS